jgi:hypothetical protein
MLNFLSYKRNANQNYTEILFYPSWIGQSSRNQTITNTGEDAEKKDSFYAIGGNVN